MISEISELKGKQVDPKEDLFRRSWVDKRYYNADLTPTSRCFKLRDSDHGKLSFDVQRLSTPELSIKDSSKFVLLEINSGEIYKLGLNVIHDPIIDPEGDNHNPAHALVPLNEVDDDEAAMDLARIARRYNF